ncbi:amidohydrolase family protein [Sulfitobacter porphyrae]|uniref:Amidohydrolase family protein n=1 Tax=Sulfitobacter porphyrae TaxID=1246864 RepID=A0ABW2B6M0_9RHOB
MGQYLHADQIAGAYAWQDIRNTGARVVFSTDWPVIPLDVMPNIKAAIAPLDLGPDWRDQTQSLHDTLASYTRDNAWVEFNEDRKGQIKAGMMADIAVMSHDLNTLPPHGDHPGAGAGDNLRWQGDLRTGLTPGGNLPIRSRRKPIRPAEGPCQRTELSSPGPVSAVSPLG